MTDDPKDGPTRPWGAMQEYMASQQEDPREAVLEGYLAHAVQQGRNEGRPGAPWVIPVEPWAILRKLDAADPLRAMLGEVVEALQYALPSLEYDTDRLLEGDYYGAGMKALAKLDEIRTLLARLCVHLTTEGGESPIGAAGRKALADERHGPTDHAPIYGDLGWCTGALYRIAQGVEDPRAAARTALDTMGMDVPPTEGGTDAT